MSNYPSVNSITDIEGGEANEGAISAAFHHPTLTRLVDGTIPWPKPGKVEVKYRMLMEKSWDMDGPGWAQNTDDALLWKLFPSTDPGNWHGFKPEFVCEVDTGMGTSKEELEGIGGLWR